ncbi:unnamed protein product [Kuraishia capsulata CBS 1993]|uniref:tRNA (guanine(10)-N(2))-methyltransferase n=1 Tax=Kuraishia capsulata CBS 1993 TaxID=1382522 RepID=W6MNN6_9ASCO|nr:uncharacterized protein KUCA_T00003873001 [Kuraishia capsulata CBS 1993]CDK27893.1 unnamed protein product [Kuraishia capsulata CBS 1993]
MKQYLIYLAQSHPGFRKAELESLAVLENIELDLADYTDESPFLVVRLQNDDEAYRLVHRSILCRGIYELWGHGDDLQSLHDSIRLTSQPHWAEYLHKSFKFEIIGYQGKKKTTKEQVALIETFEYLGFEGVIDMKTPEVRFTVLEKYHIEGGGPTAQPDHVWFGREICVSARVRGAVDEYDLKKRPYHGTTSFDAELSLVSCNLAHCSRGKVMYDPFVGTGSFLVAGAYFGSSVFGSDIDIRPLHGKDSKTKNIHANFEKYGTTHLFGDVLTMDFTNNALRDTFQIDCIVCDPPYGVREGLKVCGTKNEAKAEGKENLIINGEKAFLRKDYIQPKKPYELDLLLDDLLRFAAQKLPIGGRLCFWMPTANDELIPTLIPHHENLELIYSLVQDFNKWSRRLLVYVKRDENYKGITMSKKDRSGVNNFRDRYFSGFRPEVETEK